MKKGKAQKDILYIAISSFILVVIWIGFSIYHAYVDSTIEPDLQIQIEPIEPTFDKETINNIRNRQGVLPVYELDAQQAETASPEAELTPETSSPPISTESGIPTESGGFIEVSGA
jgi:hypothetical protein